MALQLGALRDALISANADPEKAAKAAEEVAGYENVEAKLVALGGKVDLLTWMVGFNLVMTTALLWRAFAQTVGVHS